VVSRLAAPTSISPCPQPTSRTASSPFHGTSSSRRSRAELADLAGVHHPGAGRREAHPACEADTRMRDARRLPGPQARGRRGLHQEPGTPGQEQVADDARGVEPVVRATRGTFSPTHRTLLPHATPPGVVVMARPGRPRSLNSDRPIPDWLLTSGVCTLARAGRVALDTSRSRHARGRGDRGSRLGRLAKDPAIHHRPSA
jgi:hypothetical protein